MNFYIDLTTEMMTTVLRLVVFVLLMYCAWETWRIANLVQNRRLIRLTNRLFRAFIIVAIARLVAAALDAWFSYYAIGVFSNIVNNGFYLFIAFLLVRQRRRLQIDQITIDITGGKQVPNPKYINKSRVTGLIDELLDELKIEMEDPKYKVTK